MRLEKLSVENFRNLYGELSPGPGLNILIGDNGQGKTNWLEAINILATTRSFRTSRLQEAIAFGQERAFIGGTVHQAEDITRDLRVTLQASVKSFSINGKKETLNRYLGELNTVVFSASELEIVRGQPEHRRRFLDGGIVSLHPPFVQTLSDYSKVIRQKNSLLTSARNNEDPLEKTAESLRPWNKQLAKLGGRIHRARVRLVERLNEVLEKRMFSAEEITVRYSSSLEGKGDLSEYDLLLEERLELRIQAESVSGYSLVGPHRDDLTIEFDGQDIRKFGSSGQQRSALLLLQLASITVFHATRGEYPLFLLDDIDAELDYKRIGNLLEYLEGKTQTFASTSKESVVTNFGASAAVFDALAGRLKPRSEQDIY